MIKNQDFAVTCEQATQWYARRAELVAADLERAISLHVRPHRQHIDAAVKNYSMFIHSQSGKAAMRLLEASGEQIIFGVTKGEENFRSTFALTGHGAYQIDEVVGAVWSGWDNNAPLMKVTLAEPGAMIEAAITPGPHCKAPGEIMPWLMDEIDRIIAQAPQPPATRHVVHHV